MLNINRLSYNADLSPYRFLFYQDYPWILDANREKKFASAKKVRFREKKFASAKKSSLPRKKVRFREKKFASAKKSSLPRTLEEPLVLLKKEAAAASNLLLFQDMT
ncbi:MAG: hypothetical protein ACLR23_17705 [Clostridia bacterium]